MNIADKLKSIRAIMAENNVDAIIIPSSDPHQSEYVAAHWQERAWLSGFTGSAGTVAITQKHAGLWTDSRYFIQGEMELKGTSFVLHKMINQFAAPWIDFLVDELPSGSTVAINGLMFSKSAVDSMKSTLSASNLNLLHRLDLVSQAWADRPALSMETVTLHETKYAGKSIDQKLSLIRVEMQNSGADYHLITALDDLCWTFNVRGKDVDYNPVAIAYAVIAKNDAHLFIHPGKLSKAASEALKTNHVAIHHYEHIIGFLNQLESGKSILTDPNLCSANLYEAINAKIITGTSIPKGLKAIKNEIECGHIRSVMKKDGAALAHTFYWLENILQNSEKVKETDVALQLIANRSQQKHYHNESFGAIVGYRENGAIIHYHPEPDTCKTILPEGILLVDSGGQYCDGTTDITRTFALSTPSDEEKKAYTVILQGMVALSMAKFPEGTMGVQLDTFARQFLWAEGMNYGHGTGHGVGFFMNVHEPPQGFAPNVSERGKTVHLPGMLSSNEPGFYKEGAFGMRIENLILCIPSATPGFLEFETVTLYPFEHALIDKNRLSKAEIQWINDYHKKVYAQVSPLLKGDVKSWFKEKCKKI
jgi:Xaa-Pro aminopeptidase